MRKFRLLTENLTEGVDAEIPLTEAMLHRLSTVLRLPANTEIECFDGQGRWQSAVLLSAKSLSANQADDAKDNVDNSPNNNLAKNTNNKKGKKQNSHKRKSKKESLIAKSLTAPTMSPRPQLQVHYGIALIKGERFDWALQKMTEMGVTEITPLICQHGEVKLSGERLAKKVAQWQAILIAAAEQCHLNWLPTLNMPTPITEWYTQLGKAPDKKWILSPLPISESTSNATDAPPSQLTICSGPEGGFSPEELTGAQQAGFESLTLGPRILRAETAPIAALTLGHWLWGDFS